MSKLFNSILQGFKEFGEITNNKSLLNQIDEIETSETFEEDTAHKSIYTIDYVDNTGASFKDRIKASSEEDALKKFNKKSKNFVNGVRKIKGHPYIDYLDDDASYDEIDDFTEDTVRKSNGNWTNRNDDGEEHGQFNTKSRADAQRKAMFAKGYKGENGWIKRWSSLDKYYKGDLVISKISSPCEAWHIEKVAPNGRTIKHLGNYKSLEVAMDAAEQYLIKNESKSIKNKVVPDKSLKESADYYDYPKYSKTLYLPSIRQGKVKLTIGAFSDPRYDDEHMFEILAIVDVESHRTDFTLDSKKLYLKLNINDGHETLSGYDDSYDDLEGVVDEIYDYFMTLDQDDIDDTLIELADDFDVNRVKQMFGPIDESLKESVDKSLKEPLSELATHCVYFTQDGIEQIEFEGSEDECNQYIADIQAEQDAEFGNEAPERFIKKLNEKMSILGESISPEYKMVEYTYDGDELSDYLGHVRVRTDSDKVALHAAEEYVMNKQFERNPRHFKICNDSYNNVDVIDSYGDFLTRLESVTGSESYEDMYKYVVEYTFYNVKKSVIYDKRHGHDYAETPEDAEALFQKYVKMAEARGYDSIFVKIARPIFLGTSLIDSDAIKIYSDGEIIKDNMIDESLKEAKKLRAPKFWNTRFADNVIKDYEAGKLTFDNIEEWDTAYNGGGKPNPPFNTKEILDYYLATKDTPTESAIKDWKVKQASFDVAVPAGTDFRQSDILTIKSNIKDNLVLDNYMGTGKSNYNDYQIELFHDSDNYGGYPWYYKISKDGNIVTKRCCDDNLSNALYSVAQFIYNVESKSINESLKESFKGENGKMKLKINESLEGDKPTERWAQVNLTCDSEYCYCGNGGRSWVTKDSDHIDTWPTKEEAIADGKENYKSTFKYGRDWDVVNLDKEIDNNSEDKPARWAQVNLTCDSEYCYCGNGGRSWVTKDSSKIDTWSTKEAAIEDGKQNYKSTFKYGRDWDVVKLDEDLSKDKYGDYEVIAGKYNESLNEATDNQYLYCQASIEDDIRDYLTDDELSEISSYIGSDGTIINCEFGRCDIQFSDEFIAHQIPVEYLDIEMDESLNEDSLDDHGVSRANVNLLAKRIPNGKFYFNRNRYVLGKELPDYFDDNEVILYSDYQDSDGTRIPNAYKILKRFTEDFSNITALADDCGKNTFKTSERDIRFTFNDEKSAIKFMDELRDKNIYFDELPRGVIKVNKSVALDEIYKGEDGKIKLKINEDSHNETFTEKDFNNYAKHIEDDVRRIALSISRMMQEHDEYYELFENLIDELVDILKNDSGMFQTESLKLKESTNSLDDYKVYKILINALVPNSVNLARHLSPNGECYNEIVDVLRKNGLNLADAIIDYKENPELTKRLHDMGIVHGNSTIEELTDKVLKKLDDNGYDTSDRDVRNYAEAAAELIINDVNQDIDDWYSETLINYPEDLEELPKK